MWKRSSKCGDDWLGWRKIGRVASCPPYRRAGANCWAEVVLGVWMLKPQIARFPPLPSLPPRVSQHSSQRNSLASQSQPTNRQVLRGSQDHIDTSTSNYISFNMDNSATGGSTVNWPGFNSWVSDFGEPAASEVMQAR